MEKKQVRDYMTHEVISVDASQTVGDVIRLIRTTDHDGFPVTKSGRIAGYISARDIIGEHPLTPVEQKMSRHPIVATPGLTITEVARRIFRSGLHKLPVVDDTCTLIGIVSNVDVIRSQIERVTPEKVFGFMTTLRSLHGVDTTLKREMIPVDSIQPTQPAVHLDELQGRTYELLHHLAEPVIAVKSGDRIILVDGHHRAVASQRLGQKELDAYVIYLGSDIELGLEKTAHAMNIRTLADVQTDDSPGHSLVGPTHPGLIPAEKKLVRDYMTRDVVSIDVSGTVKNVIRLIRSSPYDGYPVVDSGKVVGYIAARNIVGAKPTDSIAVLMTQVPVGTFPDTGLTDVAHTMFRHSLQKLPVIDHEGKLAGIITNSDVIRSQIEKVTPEKVFDYLAALKTLYGFEPALVRGMVPVAKLQPTQSKVYTDELDGRAYEIARGLAEPIVVVRRSGRYILIDGHHRAVAANRTGVRDLEAYIIDLRSDTELGIEKTARNMGLKTLNDVQILDESHCAVLV